MQPDEKNCIPKNLDHNLQQIETTHNAKKIFTILIVDPSSVLRDKSCIFDFIDRTHEVSLD